MAEPMNYTKAQLIDALVEEWRYLCHENGEEFNLAETRDKFINKSIKELIDETSTDEGYTLDEFMENYGDRTTNQTSK